MLETLRIIITDFQAALDKFWRDYSSDISCTSIDEIDAARSIFRHYNGILDQV
ncbi:unnamed protein product, partial [marine sediment metagenome]